MQPHEPLLTSHNSAEEPWRLRRLSRVEGRVRELMRVITREPAAGVSSIGEVVWAGNITQLHDDRGTLIAHVSRHLAASLWLPVVLAVLARAWDSEDEREVALRLPDGRLLLAEEVLPALLSEG